MEKTRIPRIMIAAAGSGSGKTTVTCGLLQALLDRGARLSSFKCGPDYIDPMFHSEVLGIKSRNLDLFFNSVETIRYLLCKNAAGSDLAVMEGVMGYYDGLAGKSTDCSSYDLSVKTETPVILIIDCKGMSVSIAAMIKGFLSLREDHGIKWVILNRLPAMLYGDIKNLIEEELKTEVLGYLPVLADCSLESRHLGLVTAQEVGNLKEIVGKVAEQIRSTVDLDRIIELAGNAPEISCKQPDELDAAKKSLLFGESCTALESAENESTYCERPKIAVAIDKAFCFYYQDNLDLLVELGAELVPFSPLADEKLPGGIQGLILGGGYPELYLEQLSANRTMQESIKSAIRAGLPCLAECGGFMYLHEGVTDREGRRFQMTGIVEGESAPMNKLTRFGYISLNAQSDTVLGGPGTELKGHEFHYWDSTNTGNSFLARKPLRNTGWDCMVSKGNLLAGYPHIHFYSNITAAAEFIRKVRGTEKL